MSDLIYPALSAVKLGCVPIHAEAPETLRR